MASIRPAAVAGLFYPHDPRELTAEIARLLAAVEPDAPRLQAPKALVVPHAGYIYSGRVAARGYEELRRARGVVRRVVLLGPVHRVAVRGLAAPSAEAFATPLGSVPVDRAAVVALADLPQVVPGDRAHALEHSLEVQLPFLQRVLGEFSVVPLAVGDASVAEVAEVIERLWGGEETLIVVSTDLSHYHRYDEARRLDAATLARIAACAVDLDHDEACGATPLNGLLACAKRRGLDVQLLAACNSGDTAGPEDRVVGYASFALHESNAGGVLVALACGAIEQRLLGRARLAPDAPWLRERGASFVTLMKSGELRGCIGSLEAAKPLGEDVADNAVGAAFGDPRFPALQAGEWTHCQVDVSVLSAPRRLAFADETELLAQISPGVDGIILEHEGRRATFLPQVWESVPDARSFLRELLRKAGSAPGTPLARCEISRYRVVKFSGR